MLDSGIKSNCLYDWADYIIPCAKGGTANLENGICASDDDNSRKRDNELLNLYLIKNGEINGYYASKFGEPKQELIKQLERLKNLEPADWYFNRFIIGILVGFECRCDEEFKGKSHKRDEQYWFKSAWKRLSEFQKRKSATSFADRGLFKMPLPFGSALLLKLETIQKQEEFNAFIEEAYPLYRESYKAFYGYFVKVPESEKASYISQLEKNPNLHPGVVSEIKGHFNVPGGVNLSSEVLLAKALAERYTK